MSEAIIFHCDVEICGSKIKKGKFVRQKEWVGLTKDEAADLWADAHDIEGRMIWTPEQLFKEIERRLKEKNT